MKELIEKIRNTKNATDEEIIKIINIDKENEGYLYEAADSVRQLHYGKDVYIRGLIEVSSFCKNDCLYCGIRRSNCNAERYRLSREDIMSCCESGYSLGFRTFVMQGGEDAYFTDDFLCDVISEIKGKYPDCAVTLSMGERSKESYQRLYDAGADRYLLRHETADKCHYEKLHPVEMSYDRRMECLMNLKEIGFQTGAGFMVGSPYQCDESIVKDIRFLQELQPHMIGIGPFIPHKDTPFKDYGAGELDKCLHILALIRLLFPKVLLPSTTALGTISEQGRILGLKAGANVVMPNLSPTDVRKKYELYNDKICTDEEAAEGKEKLVKQVEEAGYKVVTARGDYRR